MLLIMWITSENQYPLSIASFSRLYSDHYRCKHSQRTSTALCCVDPATHTPPREAALDSTLLVAQSANQQNRCFGRSNRLCIDGTSGSAEFQSAVGPQVLFEKSADRFHIESSNYRFANPQSMSSRKKRFTTKEGTVMMWISVILQVLFVVFISRNV